MEARARSWWSWGAGVVALALLVLASFQLQALESRLALQSQQIRVLGETTERVIAELKRIQAGGVASASAAPRSAEQEYPDVKLLHPEAPNYLKAKETHWPVPGAKTDGVLTVGWTGGDPKGFNPLLENSLDLRVLETYVSTPIARRNRWTDPDNWYGDLAWRVEVTDDFKTYTIYLRRGIKWHQVTGVDLNNPRFAWLKQERPVTAHDVVFYVEMLMHPQVQNGFAKNYYSELESWVALDDYTVQVKWKKKQDINLEQTLDLSPLPRFLYSANEDGTEIPKETLGVRFNQHWYNNKGILGGGPFRLAEYTPGARMRLERNEDFHGEKPAIKVINYPIYADPSLTLLKLKSGEVSYGVLRPSQYREEVLQYRDLPEAQRPKDSQFFNGQISCEEVDRPAFNYIGWNADKPMFADKRVRRAMTLALNRQQIVDKVFVGLGRVARGPYMESTPFSAPEVQPLPFDLKQAAALLKEAGWEDSDKDGLLDHALWQSSGDAKRAPFEFSLLIVSSSPEWASAANIFKEDLLSIGVKLNVESVEWSLMQKRMDEKKFDAFVGGWALGWSTDLYQIWHSSQADIPKGSNRVGFRNKRGDEIIDTLRTTLEPDARVELLREFHRILHEEQPYSFVMIPRAPSCHRQVLENVIFAKTNPVADATPWWSAQAGG